MTSISSGSNLCNRLYALAEEQNGQNTWFNLNGIPSFIIQDLDDADYVLRLNAKNYHKNMKWFRQILGQSRFTEDGKAWEARHKLTQPFLTKFDRERTCKLACFYAKETLDTLIQNSQIGNTNIGDDIFRHMTISILIHNFFGISLKDAQISTQSLEQLMTHAAEYAFVPSGEVEQRIPKELHQRLYELRRQVLIDLAPFRQGKIPSSPLLDALLYADKHDNIILEHELLTFFAAGAETTAATVGWLCYLLAKHPQEQENLFQQCRSLTNENSWEKISQISLVGAWISETLRLYPASPLLNRIAVNDDTIGSETIPAGSNVMISLIGVQHNRQLHTNPWALNLGTPEHPAQNQKNSGVNTAFSSGPRVCGGKHFALVELAGILHTFITHARFELTSLTPPVFSWKSLLVREGGQPVRVIPREGITS